MLLGKLKLRKKIFIAISAVAVLAVFGLLIRFYSNSSSKNNISAVITENIAELETASAALDLPAARARATFFHVAPLVCGVAVPQNWEGKYRLTESGNDAFFNYVSSDMTEETVFIISYYAGKDRLEPGKKALLDKNGVTVAYTLASDSGAGEEFTRMAREAIGVVKSLKCFSLN